MSDTTLLSYAVRDALREALCYPPDREIREIGCTVDYVLVDPHTFINFVLMAERDPTILPKFRKRLTEIMQHKNGS